MFKDIFTDIWLNYRGRFLCSLLLPPGYHK